MLNTDLPSTEHIRQALQALTYRQTAILSSTSGVPFTTLWKVRSGETLNPRIQTLRQFLPHLKKALKA